MKKILFVLLAGAMLWSCKKENRLAPPNTETNVPVRASPLRGGDGLYDVLGYGYDVTGEYANSSASRSMVIDVDRFKTDYPNRVEDLLPNAQDFYYTWGETSLDLSKKMAFSATGSTSIGLFKAEVSYATSESTTFSSKYVHGIYNLLIQRKQVRFNADLSLLKNYLTSEFVADLQNNDAQTIVQRYGTHVLMNVITGAKMEILYNAETVNSSRETAAKAGLKSSLASVFNIAADISVNESSASSNTSQTLRYRTFGGDPSKSLLGTRIVGTTQPVIDFSVWQASSTIANSVLVNFGPNALVPIYDLIDDPVKKAAVQTYVDQYIQGQQIVLTYTTTPLYMFYNADINDHFITTNQFELNGLANWQTRGILGNIFTDNSMTGSLALYRYYMYNGTRFYTTNFNEIGNANSQGHLEKITGYLYATQAAGSIPIYRYNYQGHHRYSINWNELGAGAAGWQYEGIIGYIKQ